jgi:hypothetical protein
VPETRISSPEARCLRARGPPWDRAVRTTYNRIAGGGLDRLSALSDGLFAIAPRIRVLERL